MSNRLNWAAMSARERDALVAEKVMGEPFRPFASILTSYPSKSLPETPHYSTDIAAAMSVINSQALTFHFFRLEKHNDTKWDVDVIAPGQDPDAGLNYSSGHADVLPELICLAALRAVGVDI